MTAPLEGLEALGLELTFAELFAGGGGLSRGLEHAGWKCRWHCENEEQAAAVLQTHWPDVPLVGDVRTVDGREMVRRYGRILMLSGGSPCQGLSSAGARKGLRDDRSILFFEQMRLWDETGADLCLWENVDGARYSEEGKDFAEVLRAFVGAAVPIPSDGWRSAGVAAGPSGVAAWRVLDSQFLGVPQRRSRVFVVGTRTGIVDPAEVLSLTEGLRRHNAPSRRTRKGTSSTSAASARGQSGNGELGFGLLDRVGGVSDPITASEGDTYTHEGVNNFRLHNVTLDDPQAIAFNAKQDGHDASAEVAPTLLAMPHDQSHANGGGQMAVVSLEPVPLDMRQLRRGEKQTKSGRGGQSPNSGTPGTGIGESGDPSPTLGAGGGPPAIVAFDVNQITHPDNRSRVEPGDPAPTLNQRGGVHVVALDSEGNSSEKISGALVTHHSAHNRGAIVEVFNEVGQEKWQGEKIAGTVTAHEAKECHTIISEVSPTLSGHQRQQADAPMVVEQTDAFAFTKSHYTRGRPGEPSPIVPTLAADTGQGDNEPLVLEVANTLTHHAKADRGERGNLVVDGAEDVVGTLSGTDGKSQLWSTQSVLSGHVRPTMGIPRRLTPLECERLMGWPELTQRIIVLVCPDGTSGGSRPNAESAGSPSPIFPQDLESIVVLAARLDAEQGRVAIRSRDERFQSFARDAEQLSSLNDPSSSLGFVRSVAIIASTVARGTLGGEAGSLLASDSFSLLPDGRMCVVVSGRETAERVIDAEGRHQALRTSFTSIISPRGLDSPASASACRTFFSCVASVIGGFIPAETWLGSTFAVELSVSAGWTLVPDPKKKRRSMLKDSARYRICGNGVTAVHAQWLGWRLRLELAGE